jgi:hypothetical protein
LIDSDFVSRHAASNESQDTEDPYPFGGIVDHLWIYGLAENNGVDLKTWK